MEIISKNERNNNERTVCSLKEIEKRKLILENAVALLLEFYCGESASFFA